MKESEGWGFETPSGGDIFCLKNFDIFTRTPVHVSKMNAVARAHLTYKMLTLLKKQPSEDGRPRSCLDQKGPKSES